MMKKILWGLAALPLLAIVATSCGKENVELSGDSDKVISFQVATGKQTLSRAMEVTAESLQGLCPADKSGHVLHLQAYGYDNKLFQKKETFNLTYGRHFEADDDASWGYSPKVYHPEFGLTWYSWYCGDENLVFNFGTDNPTQRTLSAKDGEYFEITGDIDILAAIGTSIPEEPITKLKYKHILSQVNFAIKNVPNVTIEVKDLELQYVDSAGKYIFVDYSDDEKDGTWISGSHRSYPFKKQSYVAEGDDGLTMLGNSEDGKGFMLMPQRMLNVGIFFSYTYHDHTTGADSENTFGPRFCTMDLGLGKGIDAWEPGKRYLYVFNFDIPNTISFEVMEESWQNYDEDEGEINVDPKKP